MTTERADRHNEIKAAIEEAQRTFKTELAALEERLKTNPGKLPVAKTWRPESVTYQAEFVAHEGALWQAQKDTAQAPGGVDWICVARAGRDRTDGLTPTICGTYDAHGIYKQLDVVALDGAAFVARRNNPGLCPSDGWQLLSRQGSRGHRGQTGECGQRGDKGDKGEPGTSIISWQFDLERYRLSPLMSDGKAGPIAEFHAMFERFLQELEMRWGKADGTN
jgi:hypothetical protein